MNVARLVERLEISVGFHGAPIPLRTAIEVELVSHFSLPVIQAAEKSEQLVGKVASVIAERVFAQETSGKLPVLALLGSGTDIVAGSCHVLPGDTHAVAQLKKNRLQAEAILREMQALTFNDFEKFGSAVLRELGARGAKVTAQSNDQGIDFYGSLSVGQFADAPAPFFKLAHDVSFLIAGQAKHYPTRPIGPDTVRELVGAIALSRTKTHSKASMDLFEDVDVKPFSPMLAMLFTTGELTSGAIYLSEAAGIIARSGSQLALYLADKGVGISPRGTFDPAVFRLWLDDGALIPPAGVGPPKPAAGASPPTTAPS